MNYWNNIKIANNDLFDETIKKCLYIKYYFKNVTINSFNMLNDEKYDFYLEHLLLSHLKKSKYHSNFIVFNVPDRII
jgi:hypothetical protein